ERPRAGARLLVAKDENMRNVVASAVVPTGPGVNWTLKARIGGLEPHSQYFYQWESTSGHSEVGRTRTRPPNNSATNLRLGFSSCQHYCFGYFSAHQNAADEDLDAYVFLGDYVYEHGRALSGFVRLDNVDAVDLPSYRKKYQAYRRDEGLRELHRLHPSLHVWDDHEIANNYSQNLPYATPSQRVDGWRAAFEWLPHVVFPTDRFRIWKRMKFGSLAEIFMIDTRAYRTGDNDGQPRHIMQEAQMAWLIDGLSKSKATWKIVANQVVISRDPFGTGGVADQWDGYPDDRLRLTQAIEAAGVRNVAFMTGDAHVFLCSLFGSDFGAIVADPNRTPAGVEYVAGSITSPGLERSEAEARTDAPWIQQYNGRDHGYAVVALDKDNYVTEYRRSDASRPDGGTQAFERFTQPGGLNRVTRETLAV
ncbi:MAG: alkaline phosphatase, partial [Solirubrobacteraceae bacterium]|nr:alkaline phosphatase [Solirubrobacteraceae bacterium]